METIEYNGKTYTAYNLLVKEDLTAFAALDAREKAEHFVPTEATKHRLFKTWVRRDDPRAAKA